MGMDPIRVHSNDTAPQFFGTLWDLDADLGVDISDTDVVITAKFRLKGDETVLATAVCTKVSNAPCAFKFTWPSAALTDVDPGRYEIEITVTFADGTVQTVNQHYYAGSPDDYSRELPIRVDNDF